MVCADAEVSVLDEHLAQYYAGARTALREGAACLAEDQRQWLRTVRNVCGDAACLKKAYLERLGALHALQPGATAIRYMELPRVAQLRGHAARDPRGNTDYEPSRCVFLYRLP